MNEYNKRQYLKMLESIDCFEKNTLNLGVLINNLVFLLSVLENPIQQWFNCFESECATLEGIYAIMLNRDEKEFNEDDKKSINKILNDLKNMINPMIE